MIFQDCVFIQAGGGGMGWDGMGWDDGMMGWSATPTVHSAVTVQSQCSHSACTVQRVNLRSLFDSADVALRCPVPRLGGWVGGRRSRLFE